MQIPDVLAKRVQVLHSRNEWKSCTVYFCVINEDSIFYEVDFPTTDSDEIRLLRAEHGNDKALKLWRVDMNKPGSYSYKHLA